MSCLGLLEVLASANAMKWRKRRLKTRNRLSARSGCSSISATYDVSRTASNLVGAMAIILEP